MPLWRKYLNKKRILSRKIILRPISQLVRERKFLKVNQLLKNRLENACLQNKNIKLLNQPMVGRENFRSRMLRVITHLKNKNRVLKIRILQ